MLAMHKRGIRVLVGGDYVFARTPRGTYATDLEYFVDMVGFSPMEAIKVGVMYNGQVMGMGDELGTIWEGCLADLLLVGGDPLTNIEYQGVAGSFPTRRDHSGWKTPKGA